jgi:hypothetical protein
MTITLNQQHLTARIYHGLKSLMTEGDTLSPRYLEHAICMSFGMDHVGDGNYYADGVGNDVQASVKTRMMNPHVLKTKEGRDFISHPEKFLGPQVNQKHDRWTAGVEIVQRRQALDFDDMAATAEQVGRASLTGFQKNVDESLDRYKVNQSYEIVAIHGYGHDLTNYKVSLFWQPYQHLNADSIEWQRVAYGVWGLIDVDGKKHRIMERVNGNAKREATCFKEFKNLNKYLCSASIVVPIPSPWLFNETTLLAEIQAKAPNGN